MIACLSYETGEKKRCLREKIEIIKDLLISEADPNSIVETVFCPKDSTRLHETVDLKEAEELLKSGADVNKKNGWGETPLHLAVSRGKSFDFVRLLIENGAEVNVCSGLGRTPFHLALKRGKHADEDICSLLLFCRADLDPYNRKYFSNNNRLPAYKRKWFDRADIAIIKSLLRLTLLYGYSESYVEEIKTVFLNEKAYCHEVRQFTNTCIKEVTLLKREKVGKDIFLFDLITSEPEELPLGPVELQIHFPLKYKIYYDIIENRVSRYMRRVFLFKVLQDAKMVIVSETSNKQICVDNDSLIMVCKNLGNNDVSNVVKALFDEDTLHQRLQLLEI